MNQVQGTTMPVHKGGVPIRAVEKNVQDPRTTPLYIRTVWGAIREELDVWRIQRTMGLVPHPGSQPLVVARGPRWPQFTPDGFANAVSHRHEAAHGSLVGTLWLPSLHVNVDGGLGIVEPELDETMEDVLVRTMSKSEVTIQGDFSDARQEGCVDGAAVK
jgi:hypothetical protein